MCTCWVIIYAYLYKAHLYIPQIVKVVKLKKLKETIIFLLKTNKW